MGLGGGLTAFLFVPLLALTWIFALFVSMLASHYFLSILESSGQGNDEVVLPVESFVDWMGKVVYLGFFVIIWGIPSLIMERMTRGQPELIRFLSIALPFWFLFPLGILSPMSTNARWIPFWPGLIGRMMQRFNATVQVYLITFPVAMLFFFCFSRLAKSADSMGLILVYAPLSALCLMLYARILGRYGFVLTFTRGSNDETEKLKKSETRPRRRRIPVTEEAAVFIQPNEQPGLRDPFNEEVTGYGVNLGAPPPEAPRETSTVESDDSYLVEEGFEIEEPTPERVERPDPGTSRVANPELQRAFAPPPEEEIQMFSRKKKVKEPKKPFDSTMIMFLSNQSMIGSLIRLTACFAGWSLMLHIMEMVRPG